MKAKNSSRLMRGRRRAAVRSPLLRQALLSGIPSAGNAAGTLGTCPAPAPTTRTRQRPLIFTRRTVKGGPIPLFKPWVSRRVGEQAALRKLGVPYQIHSHAAFVLSTSQGATVRLVSECHACYVVCDRHGACRAWPRAIGGDFSRVLRNCGWDGVEASLADIGSTPGARHDCVDAARAEGNALRRRRRPWQI